MTETLIETPDWFPTGPIEVGTRVVLDVAKPNAFAGFVGIVKSIVPGTIAQLQLEDRNDEWTIMYWQPDKLIRSPWQGEAIEPKDGHD